MAKPEGLNWSLCKDVEEGKADQAGEADLPESSYIIPIILKQSPFIIGGIPSLEILFLCMTERGRAKESISSVVFRIVPPLRFRRGC